MKFTIIARAMLFLAVIIVFVSSTALCEDDSIPIWGRKDVSFEKGQLPRWREGGRPYDPNQSLTPMMIVADQVSPDKDMPTMGLVASPPEYDSCRGVLFEYNSAGWPTVVTDLVVALTSDPGHSEIAYVVCQNTTQMSYAQSAFTAGGADMGKVEFIIEPTNALWIRDYGPHFIWQDSTLQIVNSQYYPTRPLDNFIPALLAQNHFNINSYAMGLYYSGGNFQPGPNRSGFVTALVNLDNPGSEGFDLDFIAELYNTYQGIDSLHIMPQLPFSVDGTGHIDMWFYIVNDSTVIISEFLAGSDPQAISVTENSVPYMESLGYTVYRTPAWNARHPQNNYNTHWTYTNALRVNDRIFVPAFGPGWHDYDDEDSIALEVWETAAGPDVEIVPINCYPIIWAAGAIHCITMQVPLYEHMAPSACVLWPDGGQLLVSGDTETIRWEATDTDNNDLSEAVLYYSTDDGASYELIDTVPDNGTYDWTVPELVTDSALVKVVAVSFDLDQYEAVSSGVFSIAPADQFVYDFASGAGVDRFCYGYHTYNWSQIEGNRTPVTGEVTSTSYDRMSASDATGNDYDLNRYITPDPSNNFESTHIFEFTIAEDPAEIANIEVFWEGYSDNCAMMEMYVWDYTASNWCDGDGLFSQNRFMDNWAGNADGYLEKHIRSGFDRFIDGSGQMTVLIYSERGPDGSYVTYNPSFHDYFSITTSVLLPQYVCGDASGDEVVDVSDAVMIINYAFAGGAPPDPIESGDANCDGVVDVTDAVYLVNFAFAGGNSPCDPDGNGQPDC
jgi:agmatine deiminase